jgi:hypothetical protein
MGMAQAEVERARKRYGRLIDDAATRHDAVLDVTIDDRADQVSSRLMERFRERSVTAVMIRLDEQDVGVSTRDKVRSAVGVAGGELGGGDRAGLPGRSTRYRAIKFICRTCNDIEVRSYYDEREIPACPAHGRMELDA